MTMDLPIHEQLLLLALRDDEGSLERGTGAVGFALAGGLFAELVLRGRIDVDDEKPHRVTLVDSAATDDVLLDECLALVGEASKPRGAEAWVTRFSGLSRLRHRIAESLCRKGILRDDEERLLLVFTRKVYPTVDPGPEEALVQQLRTAIFEDGTEIADRTVVAVSLADATGLLRVPFDKKALRERKARLEALVSGEFAVGAAAQAVRAAQATQAAVQAAVIAATSAATTTTIVSS